MSIKHNKTPINIHPLYSPRTSYKRIKEHDQRMIADMTLNFDKLTINMLKDQFLKKNNQLNLSEFIDIACRHLKFWQVQLPNRQSRLIRYLTYLFKEIDINGNGDMEWQQFTNYIIQKATVLKNLKSKNDEVKHYIKSQITPKIKIDSLILKLQYLSDIDKIAYYEESANNIYFINAETGDVSNKVLNITPKKLVVNISSVKKEKNGKVLIRKKDLILPTSVRVLDMLYLHQKKYRILLVSTSDGYVRGWKFTQNGIVLATQPDNEEQVFQHHFSAQIYCLAWDNINEVLYCGQKSGGIYMWNLKTDLQKVLSQPKGGQQYEGEQKVNLLITCMITMPKLQFMASGRMDGRLILWDTINSKQKWQYKEHNRGILSIAFNQTMILLFSAGFDHKICIWNPYISSLIHKIQGHLSPILSLKVIEGTHQLISMDSEGIVKITDTRRFNIISSFSVQTEGRLGGNITSLIAIHKPAKQTLRLAFGGKNIWIYQYDKNYCPSSADESTVVACRYVKQMLCFFTPANNKVKVWSSLNGDIQKIYMDITNFEITAFDFDCLKKRMIIGDSKGNIALYNTANGAKMKNLTRHTGQITYLIATQHSEAKQDIFISCGLDNQIRISRQTEESFEVIRTIFIKKQVQISSLKYCLSNKLIMVGTNAGSLTFFDIQTGKCVGSFLQDSNQQFTSICLARKQIIITTSSNGNIIFIGIPPFPFRFEKLISFKHVDCQKQSHLGLGLRLSCFNKKQNLLYVVDDKMNLSCYQINDLFQFLESNELSKQKIQCQRKNYIKDVISKASISLRWQVKAHTEPIRVLQFIQEQNILMTSSYDKKVIIWNAKTGELIDSLQQNYNKSIPEPLAYYDDKKTLLYTKDRRRVFENISLPIAQLDFDPFIVKSLIKGRQQYYPISRSNQQWNLQINFKDIVEHQIKQFDMVLSDLKAYQSLKQQHYFQEGLNLIDRKMEIIDKNRKLLKQIRNQDKEPETKCQNSQSYRKERKYSTNYFRRSMVKCIQNFIEKNESQELIQNLKKDKAKLIGKDKYLDYIPIYKMIHQSQKTMKQRSVHKQYILDLAHQETQNLINSKKKSQIFLSKPQSYAANKLYKILKTTESRSNNLPIKYMCKENKNQKNSQLTTTNGQRCLPVKKSIFFGLRKQKTSNNSEQKLPQLDNLKQS